MEGRARLLPPGEMGRLGLLALERETAVSLTLCPLGSPPTKEHERWLVVGKPDERKPLHIRPQSI